MTTLERSYRHCTRVTRARGSSFFWSTRLLPRSKRAHVYALYALARTADDIVDSPQVSGNDPGVALSDFARSFVTDLEQGRSNDPVMMAAIDTVRRYEITPDAFQRFFKAMEMDLTVTSYDTWDELLGYMDGSAAVIGEMMLPILDPIDPAAALAPARDLGLAFQLTNFLRDIDEDLDRGRQYLPQEDLRRFGVDLDVRRATPEFVALMRFEIIRCRALYRSAEAGIELLPRPSARTIRAAHTVYGRILDRIESLDHDVFSARAQVSTPTKLALTARQLVT